MDQDIALLEINMISFVDAVHTNKPQYYTERRVLISFWFPSGISKLNKDSLYNFVHRWKISWSKTWRPVWNDSAELIVEFVVH